MSGWVGIFSCFSLRLPISTWVILGTFFLDPVSIYLSCIFLHDIILPLVLELERSTASWPFVSLHCGLLFHFSISDGSNPKSSKFLFSSRNVKKELIRLSKTKPRGWKTWKDWTLIWACWHSIHHYTVL